MNSNSPTQILDYIDLLNRNTNTAIFVFNIETKELEWVNGAFEKLIGKSLKDLEEGVFSLQELIHKDDRSFVTETLLAAIKEHKKKNLEFRIISGKEEKWICLTTIPNMDDAGQPLLIGNIEDVTRSKNLTFNMDKYNSKKNATLNIISHDLASPLNNIQQLAELINNRVKKYNDPEIEKLINYIKDTSKKGTDLIQDFIAQEFLESSEADVIKKRIDIVQKIKIIEEDYKNSESIIHKKFNFYYSKPELFVHIDDMKFMQVLNNIYSNAIKFTKDDAIINTRVEDKKDTVLISIEDNGVGIPEHLQPLLFEKFTKARRPGLKGEKTTGLGLSLAKIIVEWHNGKIWVKSEVNKGTTFFVEIPKQPGQ